MQTLKFEKGMKLFTDIHGGLSAEETINNLDQIAPEMTSMTMEWIFADLYSNDAIDMKTREIANIAALVSIGALPQLRNHILSALRVGLTADEIKHIILNTTIIVGFPKIVNALILLKTILAENEKL